jgi:hypothetical protein
MYIEGTGMTEGEGCEHVFSSSNDLARSTRHASTFHCHQTIEEHFTFWDQDKYAALSNFILRTAHIQCNQLIVLTGIFLRNHYREALTLIYTLSAELSAIKEALNLTDANFSQFHVDERSYLESLTEQPLSD